MFANVSAFGIRAANESRPNIEGIVCDSVLATVKYGLGVDEALPGNGSPVPPPFTGNLLINPVLLFVGGAPVVPASGRFTWPLSLAGFTGVEQVLAVDVATFTGAISNMER